MIFTSIWECVFVDNCFHFYYGNDVTKNSQPDQNIIYKYMLVMATEEIIYIENGETQSRLTYVTDAKGNCVNDFSQVGYNYGSDLPNYTGLEDGWNIIDVMSPSGGDDTTYVQNVINTAPDYSIIRFQVGTYIFSDPIVVDRSNTIIRGYYNSSDPTNENVNTILFNTKVYPSDIDTLTQINQQLRTVLRIGGVFTYTPWVNQVAPSTTNIVTLYVPSGSRSFEVLSASGYNIGDRICIVHPFSGAWLSAINGGGVFSDPAWTTTTDNIIFNRKITNIVGNVITTDVPLYYQLDTSLVQCYIYKYDMANVRTNVGVENIQIKIDTNAIDDITHCWSALNLVRLHNCWVKNVSVSQFLHSGIYLSNTTHVTIDNCLSRSTIGHPTTGERRCMYNCSRGSNNILFRNCLSQDARHSYIANGHTTVSGVVYYNCTGINDYLDSGGHHRWSMGLLFDNTTFAQPNLTYLDFQLGLYNRVDAGTSHGWASANSVLWRCSANKILIQQPPTSQNWAVACTGQVVNGSSGDPIGVNQPTSSLNGSLYLAQRTQMMGAGINPSAPRITSVVQNNNNNIVSWLPTLDVTNPIYYVYRKVNNGQYQQITTTTATQYTDTSMLNGTITYRIRTYNSINGNKSPYSNQVSLLVKWRYVRLYIPAGQNKSVDLKEFRILNGTTNIGSGKPSSSYTASSQQSSTYSPSKAFDRITSTMWRALVNTNEKWIRADLGSPQQITSITMSYNSINFPTSFVRQISNDNVTWGTFV